MDFEPYFKVHNLVSVQPKSIILGQMTNLNMIFHVVVSVYRLVKIRNSPQFPDEFRNSLLKYLSAQMWAMPFPENQAELPEVLRVIDRSDRNPPITAVSVTFRPSASC